MKNEYANEDPIVAEVRAARASLTKGFKSTRAYMEHLRDHPAPGVKFASPAPRKPAAVKLRRVG